MPGDRRLFADSLAQQGLGQGREVGDRAGGRIRLILADDAERLAPAILTLEGDGAAKDDRLRVCRRLDQLGRGPSGAVVAQVAGGAGRLQRQGAFERRQPGGGDQIGVCLLYTSDAADE